MKTEIIKEYLTRFPEVPSLSLAKAIYAKYNHIFTNVEQVRGKIRFYRGASGEEHRAKITDKSFFNQNYSMNKYGIPKEIEISYDPFIMPKAQNNILVLNDIHIPFHDSVPIELALDWGEAHHVNTLLLNGDILDFYDISRFIKTPNVVRVKEEIAMCKEFIEGIHKALPSWKIYYKIGNHEERLENYMKLKAPELYEMVDWQLSTLLGLPYVDFISDKRIIYAGGLAILHGHEFNGVSSSVSVARGVYNKTKECAAVGHLHQVSEYTEPNLSGKITTTWSIGCMCQLHPEYARLNKWAHGFLNVKVLDDGDFKVFNARIHNGRIL